MTAIVTNTNGTAKDASGKALAKPAPITILRAEFEKWKPTLKAVLPKHLDADRIIKMATAAFLRSEDLQKCTVVSIIKATIVAAELGLEPGGLLGECYLVPFNNKKKVRDGNVWKDVPVTEATLIPGYKGLIKLARQSGDISTISAYVVDEADAFHVELGLEPKLTHVPNMSNKTGNAKAFYCVVKFKDGGFHFEVMTKAEVDAIRARSKASGSGPWTTDYGWMGRKTVIKQALKMVTLSSEKPQVAIAVAADNSAEMGEVFSTETTDALTGEEAPQQLVQATESRTSRLADTLASKVVDAEFDSETGEVKS
jgi:recombination protein RecT